MQPHGTENLQPHTNRGGIQATAIWHLHETPGARKAQPTKFAISREGYACHAQTREVTVAEEWLYTDVASEYRTNSPCHDVWVGNQLILVLLSKTLASSVASNPTPMRIHDLVDLARALAGVKAKPATVCIGCD